MRTSSRLVALLDRHQAGPGAGARGRYRAGMASRITELVLDCRDPAGLAAWWAEVLGYEVVGTEDGATEIGPPGQEAAGAVPTIVFSPAAARARRPGRGRWR